MAGAGGQQASQALQARLLPFFRRLLAGTQGGHTRAQAVLGAHLSNTRSGAGSEFADHRPYHPGDDLRHVNARLWARLGKPMVRQYQQEQARSFLLVVDRSASMSLGAPRTWDSAWPLAASVLCAAAGNHDTWRVLLANDTTSLLAPSAPLTAVAALAATEPRGATDLAGTSSAILASRVSANTEVVWVSDFLDRAGVEPSLEQLRRARCTPLLVCTRPANEAAVPRTSELVRLRDVETTDTITVPLTRERLAQSKAAQLAYYKALERLCGRTGVPFMHVMPDIHASLEVDAQRVLRATGLRF